MIVSSYCTASVIQMICEPVDVLRILYKLKLKYFRKLFHFENTVLMGALRLIATLSILEQLYN